MADASQKYPAGFINYVPDSTASDAATLQETTAQLDNLASIMKNNVLVFGIPDLMESDLYERQESPPIPVIGPTHIKDLTRIPPSFDRIQQSLKELDAGKGRDFREVLDELRSRHLPQS